MLLIYKEAQVGTEYFRFSEVWMEKSLELILFHQHSFTRTEVGIPLTSINKFSGAHPAK